MPTLTAALTSPPALLQFRHRHRVCGCFCCQVLVLKAYLKACRLNEVNTGGLSSYSLTNMVIAHLQEELKVRAWHAGRRVCCARVLSYRGSRRGHAAAEARCRVDGAGQGKWEVAKR